MEPTRVVTGILLIALSAVICVGGGVLFRGVAADGILVMQEEAKTASLQAQADLAQASANEMEEQAHLEEAAGNRALKEGQADALTTAADAAARTVDTSNRNVAIWGMTLPLMPLVYGGVALVIGSLAGGAIGYTIGRDRAWKMLLGYKAINKEQAAPPELVKVGAE